MTYKELKENYNASSMKEIQIQALKEDSNIKQAELILKDLLENYIYEEAKQGNNNVIIAGFILEDMFLKEDNTIDFKLYDFVFKLLGDLGYKVEENNSISMDSSRELTVDISW